MALQKKWILFFSILVSQIVSSAQPTLDSIISKRKSNTIVIDSRVYVKNIEHIPEDIYIEIKPGGSLDFSFYKASKFTFNSWLDAGRYKVFHVVSDLIISLSNNKTIYPEWWDAKNVDPRISTLGLERSVASALHASKVLSLTGVYYIDRAIKFPELATKYWKIEGPATIMQKNQEGIFYIVSSENPKLPHTNWVIDHINFRWENRYSLEIENEQPKIKTFAIGFENLAKNSSGSYTTAKSFVISNVDIKDCDRGIGQVNISGQSNPNYIWSFTLEHIYGQRINESLIALGTPSGVGGMPGISLQHVFYHGGTQDDRAFSKKFTFPVIDLVGVKASIDNIEVIRHEGPIIRSRNGHLSIGLIKSEVSYLGVDYSFYEFDNVTATINNLQVLTTSVERNSTNHFLLKENKSSIIISQLTVEKIYHFNSLGEKIRDRVEKETPNFYLFNKITADNNFKILNLKGEVWNYLHDGSAKRFD